MAMAPELLKVPELIVISALEFTVREFTATEEVTIGWLVTSGITTSTEDEGTIDADQLVGS